MRRIDSWFVASSGAALKKEIQDKGTCAFYDQLMSHYLSPLPECGNNVHGQPGYHAGHEYVPARDHLENSEQRNYREKRASDKNVGKTANDEPGDQPGQDYRRANRGQDKCPPCRQARR